MHRADGLTFPQFMEQMNKLCDKALGVDIDDLPDNDFFRGYYEDDLSPQDAWDLFEEDMRGIM